MVNMDLLVVEANCSSLHMCVAFGLIIVNIVWVFIYFFSVKNMQIELRICKSINLERLIIYKLIEDLVCMNYNIAGSSYTMSLKHLAGYRKEWMLTWALPLLPQPENRSCTQFLVTIVASFLGIYLPFSWYPCHPRQPVRHWERGGLVRAGYTCIHGCLLSQVL